MAHVTVRFAHQREFRGLGSALQTKSNMAARQFQRKEEEAAFYRMSTMPGRPSVYTTHFQPKPVNSQDMYARDATTHLQHSPCETYVDKIHGGSRLAGVVYNPRQEDSRSKQMSKKNFNATFGKRSNGDCQRLKNNTLRDQGNFHDPPAELSAYNYPKRGKPIESFKKLRDAENTAPKFKTVFYPHLHTTAQDMEAHESRVHQKLSPRSLYNDKTHANGIKNFDHNPATPNKWLGKSNFKASFGKATIVYDSPGLKNATCYNQSDDWVQHPNSSPSKSLTKSQTLTQVQSSPVRVKKSKFNAPNGFTSSMLNSKSMNALAEYDRLSQISKQHRGLTGVLQPSRSTMGRSIPRRSMGGSVGVDRSYQEYSPPLTEVDIQMRSELGEQRYTVRTPSMVTPQFGATLEPEFGSSLLRNSGQSQLSQSQQ